MVWISKCKLIHEFINNVMFVKGLFDNFLGSGIVCLLAQLSVLLGPNQVDCGLPSGLIWTKGDILERLLRSRPIQHTSFVGILSPTRIFRPSYRMWFATCTQAISSYLNYKSVVIREQFVGHTNLFLSWVKFDWCFAHQLWSETGKHPDSRAVKMCQNTEQLLRKFHSITDGVNGFREQSLQST